MLKRMDKNEDRRYITMKKNKELRGNYQKYNNNNPLMRIVISNFLKKIKDLIDMIKFDNMLDIGCGEGFVLHYLRSKNATGVDISRTALKVAKSLNPNYKFIEASIYDLPFKNDNFDIIIVLEVLEHLEDPQKAIDKIKRFSKRYFVFSVPNEPWFRIMNILRGKNISRYGNDIDHVQNWNSTKFIRLIEKNFDIISIKKPFPWTVVLCEKR